MNFGVQEFFGLLRSCESLGCKIASEDFTAERCEKQSLGWRIWAFLSLALLVCCSMAFSCLYVRWPLLRRLVHCWDEKRERLSSDSE